MEQEFVLIVDDEREMRIFLSTLFEIGGYRAVTAENGSQGIEKARAHCPDPVTLYIMGPGEGGGSCISSSEPRSSAGRLR